MKAKSFVENSPVKNASKHIESQSIESGVVYEPITMQNAQSALEEAMLDLKE